MKFNSQLPPVRLPSSSGELAAKDAEHAGNKRASEASPPLDLPLENKKLRRSFSFPSPLQKRFIEEKDSGAFAHFRYDDPFASDHRNSPPALTQIHHPTFIPFNSTSATTLVAQKVADSIKGYLSKIGKDVLTTSEFDTIVQNYVKQGGDELEQRFDHALQNVIPGQSPERLQSAREPAKEHIIQSANEACRSEGWALPVPEGSNVAWESGPLLIKRGLSLQQLKLNKADIARGGFGSVSIFENENGNKLIGKISYNNMRDGKGGIKDDLADELKGFQIIYGDIKKAGPHPNLVNVYGIAEVPYGEETKRALLMDFIPGPTGRKTFDVLHRCWDAGKISSEQYWGAVQFIARRLLDVTGHISKVGLVHNDIKPDNFLMNEKTGEAVLIDLGCYGETRKLWLGGTKGFASPEAMSYTETVDERSDVFTVGASILYGVEGGKVEEPNKGLLRENAFRDGEGNVVRNPGTYSADTAYTKFMNSVMEKDKGLRADSEKAKNLAFLNLNERMLDDDAAKKIIKDAIELAKEEEQKPITEQWKRAKPQRFSKQNKLLDALKNNPDPEGSTSLPTASKEEALDRRNRRLAKRAKLQDKKPKKILDKNSLNSSLGPIVKETAMRFITDATWFEDAKRILETVPKTTKSGVYRNSVPLNSKTEPDYEHPERAVMSARQNLASYVEIENVRRYVIDAEEFLLDVRILEGKSDHETAIEQVRERTAVARRIVEIFDTDLFKPEKGHVQKRASELESLLMQIKWPGNPPASE